MSKLKRKLCILTAAIMLLTMTGADVFAVDGISAQNDPESEAVNGEVVVSDEMIIDEGTDGTEADAEGTVKDTAGTEGETAGTAEEPLMKAAEDNATLEEPGEDPDGDSGGEPEPLEVDAVKNLTALSGYNQIKLIWEKSENAKYYIVQRALAGTENYRTLAKKQTKCYYLDTKMWVGQKVYSEYHCDKYTYRVYAVGKDKNNGNKIVKSEPSMVSKMPVRPMTITVTLKSGKRLRGVYLRRGTKVVTTKFNYGRYTFHHKGHKYAVSRIAVRHPRANYVKPARENAANTYTTADAEFFLNKFMRKRKTRKRYMVWVNLYNQHLFLMKKKNGKWTSYMDWEVSSGKAGTPSPSGNRHIRRGLNVRHDVKYWLCYQSTFALHGIRGKSAWGNMHMFFKKSGKSKFGHLMSHGCIRSPNEKQRILWRTLGGHKARGTWLIIR